jgi:hypothetical protein
MLPQAVLFLTLCNKIGFNGPHSLHSLHESPAGRGHGEQGEGVHHFHQC